MGKRSQSRSLSPKKTERQRSRSKESRKQRSRSRSGEKQRNVKPLREERRQVEQYQEGGISIESANAKVNELWEKRKEEQLAHDEAMLKVQQKYGFTKKAEHKGPEKLEGVSSFNPVMIEVIVNDRLGKKERIKCLPQDTIGIFKKLIQAKTGTRHDKIKLQKQHQVFKDHITLEDYEIHDGMSIEMYYN